MRYEKSLDGFRAVAVSLVVIHHWSLFNPELHSLPLGMMGVTMFFVLSGFLITGILNKAKESDQSMGAVFKNFYIRRSLRIFPVYYLFIFILFLTGNFDSGKQFLSCFTYTSNFYIFSINQWTGVTSHLWSLAVEEQFYLIWPFIFLFSRKNAKTLLCLFLGVGILSRLILIFLYPDNAFVSLLTPTCFDSFALGGVLAIYTQDSKVEERVKWFKALNLVAFVSLIGYSAELFFRTSSLVITERLYVSIISVWGINFLYNGEGSLLKSVLALSPLVYVGKISYGIYLYHTVTTSFYNYLQAETQYRQLYIPFTKYTLVPWVGGYKQIILYTLFLIFISSVSWFVIEKPINSLKSKFSL